MKYVLHEDIRVYGEEMTGCWRKLHRGAQNDLYSLRRMSRTCSMHGNKEICT
jgi:hypothetical protein